MFTLKNYKFDHKFLGLLLGKEEGGAIVPQPDLELSFCRAFRELWGTYFQSRKSGERVLFECATCW